MPYVSVIGPAHGARPLEYNTAFEVGRRLAIAQCVVVTGGRGGVMAAVAEGCRVEKGACIGLLPDDDRDDADPNLTLSFPTGLGQLRNGLVVRAADGIIAVGGSWGTLSELAMAQRLRIPVVTVHGWTVLDADGQPVDIPRAHDAAHAVVMLLRMLS